MSMEMQVLKILADAMQAGASDILIVSGGPLCYKINGRVEHAAEERLSPDDTENLIRQIYALDHQRDLSTLLDAGDDDFSFSVSGLGRFRCSAYKQRGSLSAVLRAVAFSLPDAEELHIPPAVLQLCDRQKGLVLVTGPAGSGKSTTLACMINRINHTRSGHVITLEDPIEYLHRHDKSIVSQREISIDTLSYVNALRASLRQSPDVILLGEMRDYETMDVAMTAAETGHLVFSTLHTIGAANTIDRIIDVFPANQQRQIAVQLSMVLQAVISQQLVPALDGTQVPAFEIMTVTPAIRNMIRDNKIPQIDGTVYSANKEDMHSMDYSLQLLVKEGTVAPETALSYASNPEMLKKKL